MATLNKFQTTIGGEALSVVRAKTLRTVVANLIKKDKGDVLRSRVGAKTATIVFLDGDKERRVRVTPV